jgi:hypothetical protein
MRKSAHQYLFWWKRNLEKDAKLFTDTMIFWPLLKSLVDYLGIF